MTDDPTYLLFPSICGKIRCRLFIFIFFINNIVDVGCDTTSYEMIPSYLILDVDKLGCYWKGGDLFVIVICDKMMNYALC